ncbi:hypothetical protein C4546_04670 [Candidatus Parcubacteria bacterium]|jgi:hypothetical protein|nr:MAG: hypothetical protein C4546_04670 [Candidatus Parcubacteria bacterium]
MIDATKNIRFTIPPFIFALFVLLAQFFIPEKLDFIPEKLHFLFSKTSELNTLITSALAIVAIGFIFSSVATLITRLGGCLQPKWKEKYRIKLRELSGQEIDADKPSFKNEFIEWLSHNEAPNNIKDNIQKRWEWFQINISSAIATTASAFYLLILNSEIIYKNSDISPFYFLIIVVFISIFIQNAIDNYKDVTEADNLLVEFITKRVNINKIESPSNQVKCKYSKDT